LGSLIDYTCPSGCCLLADSLAAIAFLIIAPFFVVVGPLFRQHVVSDVTFNEF
jgi:hypothetical protein